MKRIILIMVIFCISCNTEKPNMGIKYNEESKLIDILNQPKYKVLKEDKQYNEYIEDYINT